LPQSSSRSRRTASLAGFFDLSQTFDGPPRWGASVRLLTMPLQPHAASVLEHGCAVVGEMLDEVDGISGGVKQFGEALLALDQRDVTQILAVVRGGCTATDDVAGVE
jgi:hypothetical protein